MTPTQFEMLSVIYELERAENVKSLFNVAAQSLMDYACSWRVLGRLERDGLAEVVRNGAGMPLKITVTEKGQKAIQERRAMLQETLWEAI